MTLRVINDMDIKERLQWHKTIKVEGVKFTIKKLNPLQDFAAKDMPQIFTSYISGRKMPENPVYTPEQLQKNLEDMKKVVYAGVVKPELARLGTGENRGKEPGVTVDDLFVDLEMGTKLYFEILAHSLNKYRGIKGLFFSIKIKHLLFTGLRRSSASSPAI